MQGSGPVVKSAAEAIQAWAKSRWCAVMRSSSALLDGMEFDDEESELEVA